MDEYPIIVVPEWGYLKPRFKKELLIYVETGGKLLLLGPDAAAMFKRPLGISLCSVRPRKASNGWSITAGCAE